MADDNVAVYGIARYSWDEKERTLTVANAHTKSPEIMGGDFAEFYKYSSSFRNWTDSLTPERKQRLDAALASNDKNRIYATFHALADETSVTIKYGNS